ncbi:MAG: RDD family protein [Corynebacterium sp.]|nr:RDD family protein [Corynebacterium sp.]
MSQKKRRSWLEGPQIPAEFDGSDAQSRWPGEKIGLPQSGPGALASVMRRVGGVAIDWFMSLFIAGIITAFTHQLGGLSTVTLIVFFILGILSVWLFARTPGQLILSMGVARIDAEARVGLWRAVVRTLLTCFIFPAIIVDSDGRGLHDRATGTAVILG